MAKTSIVSFRIEEDKLDYIDQIITSESSSTGIRTRSEFMSEAIDFYLAKKKVKDPKLLMLKQLQTAREEGAFWKGVVSQLGDLLAQDSIARLDKASEVLETAASLLTDDTYNADIDHWRELLSSRRENFRI